MKSILDPTFRCTPPTRGGIPEPPRDRVEPMPAAASGKSGVSSQKNGRP